MEFVINKFLSLKLESDITMIYVAEEPFHQCKFLLLEIPVRDITYLDDIKSIDQAAQELGRSPTLRLHAGFMWLPPLCRCNWAELDQ